MKLGIDIGRVLISPDTHGKQDTSFIGGSLQDALDTPPYDGMLEVVPALVQLFGGQVWLVSKCGPRVQEKSRLWLRHHRFFERTGIAPDNLRFCLERPQKADHCAELGITHFIDDRLDVLQHLNGIVAHRYLFGPQKKQLSVQGVVAVPAWDQALALIGNTLVTA
ncbi:hypothetical protein [Massilia sp. CF038]|uniref:hypothetical protein n=1 Tax=Massilia sp. CF038 TaxID=1881045 RepID=UPI00091D6C8A|nr:hypothetical protein [Massilia sp. CF038]SHH54510.1 hypothetical protein SAMN05428948_4386 [Massilia sp. CF038]